MLSDILTMLLGFELEPETGNQVGAELDPNG